MNFFYRKIMVIYNVFYAFIVKLYLTLCCFYKKKNIRISSIKPKVVVSLTSYNKRFNTLMWTLESLMQQKTSFEYRIVLVLSEEDLNIYGGRPKYLEQFERRGLEVVVVKENLKSFKKAYYTYDQKIPLVTADDDVFYPSWWLKGLMDEHEKTPNLVLAYRGHYILSKKNQIMPYVEWMKWSQQNFTEEAKYSFLPTGTSGILYPVNSLNGLKESKQDFLELCAHADDFWFKYLTVMNGFKARRICKKNIHFALMTKGDSLFDLNVVGGLNDKQFMAILKNNSVFKERIYSDQENIKV